MRTGTSYTCRLGQPRQPDRSVMVDVIGDLRGERSERVVRQRGKMNDRVESDELLNRHVSEIDAQRRRIQRRRPETQSSK